MRVAISVLTVISGLCVGLATPIVAQAPDLIRVPLTREEGVVEDVGTGVNFDSKAVAEALAKESVKLPEPLPTGARVGYASGARIFLIVEPGPSPDTAFLTIDANGNRDLRDDARVEAKRQQNGRTTAIVKVHRSYPGTPPTNIALPYYFSYSVRDSEPDVFISADYRLQGEFTVAGRDYALTLSDFLLQGQFSRANLTKGTVLRVGKKDSPPADVPRFWGYELIPLEDELYEVSECALDGSWIELRRNTLPRAAIGRLVPDYRLTDTEGRSFGLSEYRGRYLLLDFWPSWCGPCVAQFATIKQTIEHYADKPLAVVGVNLDSGKGVDEAKKIITQKALTWRQVVEGRDMFLPAYQQLGRLPEHQATFPLYVVVGPDGVIRYATNSFDKMQRFLEAAFSAVSKAGDVLFIPLRPPAKFVVAKPLPVDLSPAAATALRADPKLKLPPDTGQDARLGRMPNGTALLVRPGADRTRLMLRLDADRDGDLTKHQEQEIPVFNAPPADFQKAPALDMIITYAGGAQSYLPYRFVGVAGPGDAEPRLFYYGWQRTCTGPFVADGVEYEISIADPTSDGIITPEDIQSASLLTLRKKTGTTWTTVCSGSKDIPVADHLFRIRHVHDDGLLVELERQ